MLNQTKRLFTILCLSLIITISLSATMMAEAGFGFAPNHYKSGYTFGTGIYFAPNDITIYAEPNEASEVVERLHWEKDTQNGLTSTLHNTQVRSDHVFFCFYPELSVAMLAVIGDTDDGWVEVVYDQADRKTGWVKVRPQDVKPASPELAHMGVYQTWLEFMKLNSRANGIYWLNGVSQYHRSVRSVDRDDAKFVPVTIIRDIKVRHVRGNWLLVEVLDFQRTTPIGWVRWRDGDGNLLVFPNLAGKHVPIVTTVY